MNLKNVLKEFIKIKNKDLENTNYYIDIIDNNKEKKLLNKELLSTICDAFENYVAFLWLSNYNKKITNSLVYWDASFIVNYLHDVNNNNHAHVIMKTKDTNEIVGSVTLLHEKIHSNNIILNFFKEIFSLLYVIYASLPFFGIGIPIGFFKYIRRVIEYFPTMENERHKTMNKHFYNTQFKYYIYVQLVSVRKKHQGNRIGTHLIDVITKSIDKIKLPSYLETNYDYLVKFYKKYGYQVETKYSATHNNDTFNDSWAMYRNV